MSTITHGSILAVFFAATDAERYHGAFWYQQAREAADAIAARYGLTSRAVAGVIAALSPNNKWHRNLADADAICRAYSAGTIDDASAVKVATYHANKRKALNILSGADPLDILGGLKVRAFFANILGCQDSVCIDGHAYSIWAGQYLPTNKIPKISAKLYKSIVADYVKATDAINSITKSSYLSCQIQAITWTTWRRLANVKGVDYV